MDMKNFFTDNKGETAGYPRFYRIYEKKLAKEQRLLSRKTKGSKNYEKQRIRVARGYEKITWIRNWYYHNISSYLVQRFDAIYMENLNVSGMLKNRKLSRKSMRLPGLLWSL